MELGIKDLVLGSIRIYFTIKFIIIIILIILNSYNIFLFINYWWEYKICQAEEWMCGCRLSICTRQCNRIRNTSNKNVRSRLHNDLRIDSIQVIGIYVHSTYRYMCTCVLVYYYYIIYYRMKVIWLSISHIEYLNT